MKLSLSDFDHPLTFLFFLTLAIIPILLLIFIGAQRFGLLATQGQG